ncbi:peptide-binding protein [Deltaproteobacteria bacterium]|nr:peptide-binding protein [Deltaproteobacteria bacterium]
MHRLLLPALLLLPLIAEAGNLRFAEDQAPALVNPIYGSTMAEARVNELVFEGLYTDDTELATTPALAESSRIADDKLSMEVTLRSDVAWHDGQPLTADDVVFTIKAMQDRATASTESGRVAWIADAVALDARTVKLTFVRMEARPEDKLFFKILPKHAFNGLPVRRSDTFRTKPVGTGPWRLALFNEDNSITFKKHDGWRDAVGIDEVTLREVADKNYQAKLVLYESLEALVRVLPRDLAMLQNNRKVELYPYQTNSWWYLGYNLNRPLTANASVRRGLSELVDVDALLAPVGTGARISGPFVPSSPYYNHDVEPTVADADEAATQLTAGGLVQDGDTWKKDGRAITLTAVAPTSLESVQEVAINLQSQLQSAGIKLDVQFLDDATWKQRVWRDHDYDLLLGQWTFDRNEDIREQFHSLGTRNFVGYKNPAVDALLDKARDATDPYVRKATLREAHKLIAADQPMLFLWTLDSYAAMSVRVKNVLIHPFYFFTFAPKWTMK